MDIANIVGILIVITLIFTSAIFRFSVILWTLVIGLGLVLVSFLKLLSPIPFIILWLGYLTVAAVANLHRLRQKYLVQPALKLLKAKLPPISATEREAIEAGNTWWEKELFCGKPNWKQLFAIQTTQLTKEEQDFIDQQVEQLCQLLNDWQIVNELNNLPENVWAYLKQEKFFGLVIPKNYGGLGFSALAHSTIIVKIATRSMSTAVNTMVPNSLGPGELLLHYGTDEQKDYYLPRLAAGIEIPCFALTAPDAGSDAGAIPDVGIVCKGMFEGKEVIGMRLNWDKRYITLAPIATVLGLAIHLYDPSHFLSEKEEIGITLCLIPASHPGVEIGTRHYPMYQAFMNGPTRGKDVFIPLDWIIGGQKMAGQGWRMLMECLSIGRSISLPALSTACSKVTYRFTGAYSQIRRQFNLPLAAFEGIQEALGYIAGYTYTLEATRIMTASAVDLKVRPAIASAIAKYHMTEMSRCVVEHAMDVHAGQMIQLGPRNYLANAHCAMPISITVEGANILTRNLIIFGQGAIRCHPYLLKEIELISSPEPNLAELDQVLISHVGFFASNLLRSVAYGLSGGKLIFSRVKNPRIRKYHKQLTRMSAALALFADASLILLGGSLKRRERISARLGDVLSQLYLASATLKYFHDNNEPSTDVDYVCWSLHECLYKIQIAFNGLVNNYPMRWVGRVLNWLIFPYGTAYHAPRDKLHAKIIQPMLEPSEFRARMTKYCYISLNEGEASGRLEKALSCIAVIEPLRKIVHKAVQAGEIPERYDVVKRIQTAEERGLLTADEARALKEFEALKDDIIQVNEFSFDLNRVLA